MDGQYPPPFPPMGAFYSSGPPPMYPPEPFPPRLHQLQTISMESLGTYSDYDDSNRNVLPAPPGQRQRRRQHSGSEHVKHRRTRSGCYTCRQRRVKCDETHPICDRCRKGKRECIYPGASTSAASSSKPSRKGSKAGESNDSASSASEDEEGDGKPALPAILDNEEDVSEPQSAASSQSRKSSNAALAASRGSIASTAETGSSSRDASRPQANRAPSKHSVKPSISHSSRWPGLPRDVKAYLKYHKQSLSHHHYAFKYDAGDFLKTTFLEIAMNDDSQALLYAIVAFAAYHHAVASGDNKISPFLSYYNRSINMLKTSLETKRPNVTTLLTILQLATIEEFLGDWVNLLGHQRAAHQILTDLYTPMTIMQDETRRKIIGWYIRFDLFAGMMSGGETNLGREWFAVHSDFYTRQTMDRPDDLGAKFEEYFATSRLLATDVALVFAAKTKGTITHEQFSTRISALETQFEQFHERLSNALTDPSCFVRTFPKAPPPQPDDITDFRDPKFLYAGEYFTMNYVLIDFWAILLMFRYQLTVAQLRQPSPELAEIAHNKCKMFEAIQYHEHGPPGAVVGCQASLGIASLFLPKDRKHIDWCRRKYALVEQRGYIYPANLRERMSDLWGEDVTHWWLPNDEGYPDIIRTICDFIQYRAGEPTDAAGADVRDMSGIFREMNVREGEQPIPEDLRGIAIEPDLLDPSGAWASSPEYPGP
ncbi:hypothetical protein KC332_g9923 [Hortaea werneckii]|uniref:Zn(2)-C6 fungal-type domain-containing protein n=1 Tax=Hortaea werneckii EXF-2000 TaxID=1157616 RepID=A0A1Z5TMW3_HORWE|nr:hypothetical protein KC350_g18017 [Hortaea werneckii]OTA37402.1 hypothetical protein BTJ68_02211 [Hortaea werneckii EXF-2000]KAI6818987.1 hypothetical protein KC358_g9860 [Hortaea werneckii]KAI6920323.1 hypothetical protein KC348_g10435 [Hortaea werneckii]KAI6931578.1 hypothetical protein KC341_g9535 [Hortaea werneckii]